MNFDLVNTTEKRQTIERMASIIWPITYKDILSSKQIAYMLNLFLSDEAIASNIEAGYTYMILKDDKDNQIGFIAYELKSDYIFLSKLYILPIHQNKHYASDVIVYLKSFNLPIKLTVNKYNKNAYEKYLHLGFKVIDSTVTDIGNSYVMDDYVMKCEK